MWLWVCGLGVIQRKINRKWVRIIEWLACFFKDRDTGAFCVIFRCSLREFIWKNTRRPENTPVYRSCASFDFWQLVSPCRFGEESQDSELVFLKPWTLDWGKFYFKTINKDTFGSHTIKTQVILLAFVDPYGPHGHDSVTDLKFKFKLHYTAGWPILWPVVCFGMNLPVSASCVPIHSGSFPSNCIIILMNTFVCSLFLLLQNQISWD